MSDIQRKVTPKGKVTYQARIRRAGYPSKTRSFEKKSEAQAWARDTESKVLNGLQVASSKARRYTFSEAIAEFLEQHPDTDESEKVRLQQIEVDLGELAVLNLTAAKFSQYIRTWSNTIVPSPKHKKKDHPLFQPKQHTYADSSVRKIYYLVKKIMEWHSAFRNYPVDDIFKSVSPPSTDIKRDRRLEEGEEERILEAFSKQYTKAEELKTLFLFALETAMRAGEIMSLEWHEVDFSGPSINIPKEKTKTSRYRKVPMTSVCVKLLQAHQKTKSRTDTRVFWHWKDSHALGQRFRVVLKNAQITNFRFHDLRHEATSRFFERTQLRDIEIAKITGHSDMRTLARYANLKVENLARQLW
jgi:integrase